MLLLGGMSNQVFPLAVDKDEATPWSCHVRYHLFGYHRCFFGNGSCVVSRTWVPPSMRVSTCADEEGKVEKPRFSRSVYGHMLGQRLDWSIQE